MYLMILVHYYYNYEKPLLQELHIIYSLISQSQREPFMPSILVNIIKCNHHQFISLLCLVPVPRSSAV